LTNNINFVRISVMTIEKSANNNATEAKRNQRSMINTLIYRHGQKDKTVPKELGTTRIPEDLTPIYSPQEILDLGQKGKLPWQIEDDLERKMELLFREQAEEERLRLCVLFCA